jgi:phosphoglycolate phosphatase
MDDSPVATEADLQAIPPRMNDLSGAAIAFDLDGTLVDTAPDLIGVLNAMLTEHGLPVVPEAAARHLVGRGARHLLEHGFREAGAPWEEAAAPALLDRFIALYFDRIAEESRPFEGVAETLDRLKAAGARLCVCTNKRTDLSVALLKALRLDDRFEAIVGPDLVSRRKPDAAHLLEAIALAGGDRARAVMVGDSEIDFQAARAAGVPVILVPFGYTEVSLAELGADLVERFEDLPAVVERLLNPAAYRS